MHAYVCMHMQVRPNQHGRHKAPNMRACMLVRVHTCVHMRVRVCVRCEHHRESAYIHTHIQKYTHT